MTGSSTSSLSIPRVRFPFQKKHVALAALRRAYRDVSIRKGDHLREGVGLETERHATVCDFAVSNGTVLQLAQTWSFQVPDQASLAQQVKALGLDGAGPPTAWRAGAPR